jgi:hypothetical protein
LRSYKKGFKLLVYPAVILAIAVALYVWTGRSKPIAVVVKTVAYGTVRNTVTNPCAGTIKAFRRRHYRARGRCIAGLPGGTKDCLHVGTFFLT